VNTPREVIEHYNSGQEAGRLKNDFGWLERVRTEDILRRFLPPSPSTVLDIGGAAGIYALPLAEKGYEVHLLDPVPLHVEQAKNASAEQECRGAKGIITTQVGDARELPYRNESANAVLLLGPLYHLTEKQDRLRALRGVKHAVCSRNGWPANRDYFSRPLSRCHVR
jgi:ubiquinone/menaquinone biosynthesis C-methylase UbiE